MSIEGHPDRGATPRSVARYEKVSQPVAQLPRYLRRQLRSIAVGLLFIVVALFAGMLGYHRLVGLSWIDAYENAAMILSGMGPLAAPATVAGKIFAGSYALFSGIAVLAIAGVIAAPLVHRFLHRMHADSEESS
jgi:ABC-type transport system involved in cytochrome c biogenesis permease component